MSHPQVMEGLETERDEVVQIGLVIKRGTHPMTGTVQLPGQLPLTFNGSLELLTIFEEFVGQDA